MNMISFILFFTALLLLATGLRKNSDLFSPARFFGIVWTASIGLANLKLSGFQHEWSLFSWMALLVGLFSFLLGTFTAYVINLNNPLLPVKAIRQKIRTHSFNYNNLFWITVVIFIVYIVCYVAEVIIEGYLPLFSPRIEKARIEFGVFGLHLIVNSMVTLLIISIIYIVLAPPSVTKKFIMTTILIITSVSFFFLLQRYNYFLIGIMILGLFYYATNKINLKNILIGSVAFFSFLGFIQSIRLSQYVQHYIHALSKMKYSVEYAIFSEPYMYVAMNLENYARASEKLENFTYGYFTTDWILALTGLKNLLMKYYDIISRPFINSGYNTFPFHWTYYNDFGLMGVLIFPYIIGFIIAYIYYKMRRTGKLKWVVFYSLCLIIIGISFFTNPLTHLNFVFNIILIYLIFRYWISENVETKNRSKVEYL